MHSRILMVAHCNLRWAFVATKEWPQRPGLHGKTATKLPRTLNEGGNHGSLVDGAVLQKLHDVAQPVADGSIAVASVG